MTQVANEVELADSLHKAYNDLKKEIAKKIVGQDDTVDQLLISIFSQGHSLLVGVPGLAKTLLIQTLSQVLDLSFNRIQFTPDLMPSDILGSEMLDKERTFQFTKGPIFANIILADEINRTPPKTQAALLEAMQEKGVTIAGKHYDLPLPFFVLATQNPIEQEGTYPLPEAQLDRFMFNILLDYPSMEQEKEIVSLTTNDEVVKVNKVLSNEEISQFQHLVRRVPVAENVINYAVNLVHKLRPGSTVSSDLTNEYIEWGAGPRGSQTLILAAKCHAVLKGKYSPDIEDVQAIATPTLRHRLVRNFKAEAKGYSVDKLIREQL
ncbi:MAG: MoxR family ATPase [Cyclobacteriaceae bacterium]|nr:MoxR family ATPase [Cyclobacteriaceae bacterium]